jgi:hypothetical protein
VASSMAWLAPDARGGRGAWRRVAGFRSRWYGCWGPWADALFELADAVLCAGGPVCSLPRLSLEPVFGRGHGSVYAALARGAVSVEALEDLLAAGELEVVAQVGGGLGQVRGLDGKPGGDRLVQGSEHAQAQLPVQGGLASQDAGEWGRGVHLGVGQQPQLEGIRMLTNHDLDAACPLACLLIGQPTLRRRLKLGILAALDQRIAVRYQMTGMTPGETASYISHHLTLAGRSGPLFSDDATALIHTTSRGLPRAVNNLAIQALIAAYADRKAIVDEASTRTAATEITAD